jgi:hypothetical protein
MVMHTSPDDAITATFTPLLTPFNSHIADVDARLLKKAALEKRGARLLEKTAQELEKAAKAQAVSREKAAKAQAAKADRRAAATKRADDADEEERSRCEQDPGSVLAAQDPEAAAGFQTAEPRGGRRSKIRRNNASASGNGSSSGQG